MDRVHLVGSTSEAGVKLAVAMLPCVLWKLLATRASLKGSVWCASAVSEQKPTCCNT
jgi:hypothetical protein